MHPCRRVDENAGLSFEIEEKLTAQPVVMKQEIRDIMEKKAAEYGISTRTLLSGAGHDAMIMGSLCDVAMVFAVSKGGRSHVPEEWTDYTDLQNAIEVVCGTIREMASK